MKTKLTLFIIVVMGFTMVSAFPLQLMPNGSLMEMNDSMNISSINGTLVDVVITNNSIFIIPANRSIINSTNMTYLNTTTYDYRNITTTYNITNVTCNNCTYQNFTYYFNGSNLAYNRSDIYNRTEVDSFISAINSWRGQIDTNLPNYALKSDLNSSAGVSTTWKSSEKTIMWILIIVALALALFAVYLIYMASRG